MKDDIPMEGTGTEPTGETIEEYGERIVAMVRKDMLDRIPDDVIDSIKESHLVFGKACAIKSVSNAMDEMSANIEDVRPGVNDLARRAASADKLAEAAFKEGFAAGAWRKQQSPPTGTEINAAWEKREEARQALATGASHDEARQIAEGLSEDDKAVLREIASSGRLYADVAAQMLENDQAIGELRNISGEQND